MVAFIAAVAYFLFGTNTHEPIAKRYVTEMKIDLIQLRSAEEAFREESSRYTRDLGSRFALNPTLNPPTITATDSTWSATITSKRLPGAICGISFGVPNPVGAPVQEDQPVCAMPTTGLPKRR
jgi:hypothetical protein